VTPSWFDPERRAALDEAFLAGFSSVAAPQTAPTRSEVLEAIAETQRILAALPPPVTQIRAGGEAMDRLRAQATRDRPEYMGLFGIPVRVDPSLPDNMVIVDSAVGRPQVLILTPAKPPSWWRRLLARLARLVRRPS